MMKSFPVLAFFAAALLIFSTPSVRAYPYCGSGYYNGGWGGCYQGGWYGSCVPNGVGWTFFGLGAGAVAAPVTYAVAAPPVYYTPAPSIGYYAPPQRVVVEEPKKIVRQKTTASQNELLCKVQSKLAALGYYKGSIDGCFGPQTELAVTKFQGENGLTMTGRVDLKTLSSLGISL